MELIGKEDIKLSKKQVDELVELMKKEEVLEVEEQINKALLKESRLEFKKEDDKEELIEKSSSKSTVVATPVTIEKKMESEEFEDVAEMKDALSKSTKNRKHEEEITRKNSVNSQVSTSKKAEKHV